MAKMNFQGVKKEKQDLMRGLRECRKLEDFEPLIAQCEKAKKKWDSSTIECTPKQSQELVKLDGQLEQLMEEKKIHFAPQIQKKQREAMAAKQMVKIGSSVQPVVELGLHSEHETKSSDNNTNHIHPTGSMIASNPTVVQVIEVELLRRIRHSERSEESPETVHGHCQEIPHGIGDDEHQLGMAVDTVRLKKIQTIRDHLSCLAKKLEQYKTFPGEDYQAVSLAVTRIYGGLNPMVAQYLEGGIELKSFKTNAEMFLQTQETQKDIEILNTPRGWKAKTIVSNIILALATLLVGYGVGMLVTGRFALFQPKTDAGNKMDKISSAIDQLSV